MGPIFLLLLPALACADIKVNIKVSQSKRQTFANHEGSDFKTISDEERATFNITDKHLKAAVPAYSGGKPTNVYVKSPTPWGDLYKSYSWIEVKRSIEVQDVEITTFDKETVTLNKARYNNNSTMPSTYNSNFKKDVDIKIKNEFTGQNYSATIVANIDLVVGHNPPMYVKHISHLNKSYTEYKETKTLKPINEVKFTLNPGQAAESFLNATKVTMNVTLHMEIKISGDLAVNYNPRYMGHHFWAYDVKAVLKSAGEPTLKYAKDVLIIEYYSDAKFIVVDSATRSVIMEVPADYI